jgi:hypothetical protein
LAVPCFPLFLGKEKAQNNINLLFQASSLLYIWRNGHKNNPDINEMPRLLIVILS